MAKAHQITNWRIDLGKIAAIEPADKPNLRQIDVMAARLCCDKNMANLAALIKPGRPRLPRLQVDEIVIGAIAGIRGRPRTTAG